MSWQDRPYAHGDGDSGHPRHPLYRGPGAEPISVTTSIIIANIIIHVLIYGIGGRFGGFLLENGVMHAPSVLRGQVWRLLTATYLHAYGFGHIGLNMVGLYFFGPPLERVWGRRQFLLVYTLGGIAGNVVLTVAAWKGFLPLHTFGLGASGSVLTLLGAAAVLFPTAQIFVYFLFPIRIQTFVLIYGVWFVYNIWNLGPNYGGDICHLTGLLFGAGWANYGGVSISGRHHTQVDPSSAVGRIKTMIHRAPAPPTAPRTRPPPSPQSQADAETIDRILAKISQTGIESLTDEERTALRDATARQRGVSPPPAPKP